MVQSEDAAGVVQSRFRVPRHNGPMASSAVVVCLLFHFFRFFSQRSTINCGPRFQGTAQLGGLGNGQELQGLAIHPPVFSPNASPWSIFIRIKATWYVA